MTTNEVLKKLGMSKNASKVYLASLKYGISQVKDLARETGLIRQLVYEAINELVHNGLMSKESIGTNRYRYISNHPQSLNDLLNSYQKNLNQILPDLVDMYKVNKYLPRIKIYENNAACRQMLREQLELIKKVNEVYVFSSVEPWYKLNADFMDKFFEERSKIKTKSKILTSSKNDFVAQVIAKKEIYEVKILPKGENFHGDITICGDTIFFMTVDKYDIHSLAIISRQIANMQKELFFSIWNRAKPLTN